LLLSGKGEAEQAPSAEICPQSKHWTTKAAADRITVEDTKPPSVVVGQIAFSLLHRAGILF
jgi:hypothetical protein